VKTVKQILIVLGLAVNAALALSNVGLADCGGLFLLHLSDKQFSARSCSIRDSLSVGSYDFYGAFEHIAIQGRYSDQWHIKGVNEQNIASAGFEKHFKYVSVGLNINSYPFVTATISAHRLDSLFHAKATIASGTVSLGSISWLPEQENNIINSITADWESHVFYGSLEADYKIDNHYINLSLAYTKTEPHNPEKLYYVRDSASIITLGARYGHAFSHSRLNAGYSFTKADVTLYGIFHSEESHKRFMYMPLDATMHFGFANWSWERLRTHLEFAHIAGRLRSNPNRFFETLAPNRALPASVIKGLSFSFLQKVFRIDANLEASAILSGASYYWNLGSRFIFTPKVELDFFGASGELNVDKQIETTMIATRQINYENTRRKLNSIGSVLMLNCEVSKPSKNSPVIFALEYGISQIIPFYIDYKDYNADKPGEGSGSQSRISLPGIGGHSSKKPKDKEGSLDGDISSLIFRNGFATHLGVSIRF
jgi:hypothetical protein